MIPFFTASALPSLDAWRPNWLLWVMLAMLAWTAAATGWAWRYGGWLGRPRADGRPG